MLPIDLSEKLTSHKIIIVEDSGLAPGHGFPLVQALIDQCGGKNIHPIFTQNHEKSVFHSQISRFTQMVKHEISITLDSCKFLELVSTFWDTLTVCLAERRN